MAKKIQCPFCEDCYISLASLQEHIEEEHLDDIPEDFTVNQYLYYIKTGKSGAKCVMCKRPTQWNESTNKYNRLCGRKECSDKYREIFKQRMIGKYGKTTLLNDPNQQRKMLEHRKISGKYKWSDKTEKTYTGTYELDFLKMLDLFMNWDSSDIMCPSPHTYYYDYDGEKKFYIPDMYIPSLNLEIEIKESDNHHPHMQVDRKKESLKDSVMKSQRNIDYIKIVDKSYDGFFKYLSKRKDEFLSNSSKDVKDISTKLTEALDSFDRLMEIEVDPIIESAVIGTDIKQSLETLKRMIYDDTEPVQESIRSHKELKIYNDKPIMYLNMSDDGMTNFFTPCENYDAITEAINDTFHLKTYDPSPGKQFPDIVGLVSGAPVHDIQQIGIGDINIEKAMAIRNSKKVVNLYRRFRLGEFYELLKLPRDETESIYEPLLRLRKDITSLLASLKQTKNIDERTLNSIIQDFVINDYAYDSSNPEDIRTAINILVSYHEGILTLYCDMLNNNYNLLGLNSIDNRLKKYLKKNKKHTALNENMDNKYNSVLGYLDRVYNDIKVDWSNLLNRLDDVKFIIKNNFMNDIKQPVDVTYIDSEGIHTKMVHSYDEYNKIIESVNKSIIDEINRCSNQENKNFNKIRDHIVNTDFNKKYTVNESTPYYIAQTYDPTIESNCCVVDNIVHAVYESIDIAIDAIPHSIGATSTMIPYGYFKGYRIYKVTEGTLYKPSILECPVRDVFNTMYLTTENCKYKYIGTVERHVDESSDMYNNISVMPIGYEYKHHTWEWLEDNNDVKSIDENVSLEGLHDLIYNSSSEPLTETGKVITEQDSYFDYDKFVNGDSNILLITGLSGSGKSTLGKSLAEKHKAELISLDDVNIPYIIDLMNKNRITGWHSILKSYLLTKQKELLMKDDNGKYRLRYKLDVVDIVDVINDFFVYLINRLSKTKKYIIEGIHIYEVLDFENVKDFPIIIKQTSSLTSMKQMLNREYNSFVELIKYELIQYKLDILQWYHKNLKALNAFTNRLVDFKTATDNSNEYTKKVYPVYVLLMHSGTALSTAIQKITHDEFSHSSISFDSSLNSMFSFGRKFANNPVSAGFTRENVNDTFFKRPIPYALYAVFVTKDEFAKMKKNLYNFVKHKDDLGYNFQGLIKYVIGMRPETRNKYFCSEFVSTILNTTTMRTNDRAAMTKPMDLAELNDCHLIQKGLLTDYDKNVTDREVNKLLRLKNCTVKESMMVETKLSTKERNNLDVEEFGLPEERKFPLNDELRVRKAIQFFNYCPKEKRAELGKNIEKAMAKFDMKVSIGENNPAYNYISKKYIIE